MNQIVTPVKNIRGRFAVPGDKSISHRAVMFGAIASGDTRITGFLNGGDCRRTIDCFRRMGADIEENGTDVTVRGVGLGGLRKPDCVLDVGNSGTTLRLLAGLLAWQRFECEITGDASIQKRPMDRVIEPLTRMGARVSGRGGGTLAPLVIEGRPLTGIRYVMPVASAQVKSAILLAGLGAAGETVIEESAPTRDHTEIMLRHMGADITAENGRITCRPAKRLNPLDIAVPGDASSAAFLIVAATILEGSSIVIENVNVNPTRTGLIDALRMMGADITLENRRTACGEPLADIAVRSAKLRGTSIGGGLVVRMIDEIPVFAVAAACAEGRTVVADAGELMVKETNRIQTVHDELSKMGADIETTADGMIITGGAPLSGAEADSRGDHRIAMSLAVAALAASGETRIAGARCADVSFPGFFELIASL